MRIAESSDFEIITGASSGFSVDWVDALQSKTITKKCFFQRVKMHDYLCLKTVYELPDERVNIELLEKGFPSKYLTACWNYKPNIVTLNGLEYHLNFVNKVKRYIAKEFLTKDGSGIGLIFWGKVGVGKSSLLVLIAKTLCKFYLSSIRYVTMQEYLNYYTVQNLEQLELIRNSPILFIDAFGQEHYTDNRSSVVLDLFHCRYSDCNKMSTFVATNIDLSNDSNMNTVHYRQIVDYLNDVAFIKKIHFKGDTKRC